MPTGLTASLSGSTITIGGTPTVAGTFNDIQIRITDANSVLASNTYSLTITPALTLGTLGTTAWDQNEAGYSSLITIFDGTGPFGSLTQSGLPSGLTARLSGSTITISGKPTVSGTFNDIQFSVTDANGLVASGTLPALTISPAPTLLTGLLTTLDPAGSISTHVTGISGSNVVGYYEDAGNVYHGFLYNGTTLTTLDDPAAGQGFFQGTYAQGVSGNNVVGYYTDASGVEHGFVYNGTTFTTLDDPAASHVAFQGGTIAYGVSGNNVVGWYIDASNVSHGFLYNGTTFTTLDDPNAGHSLNQGTIVTGVSGSNVVGDYTDASGVEHGFLYDGTTFTTLDPAGSTDTDATGVSGSNVVGDYFDASGVEHGFLDDGTTFTTLDPTGSVGTQVMGVSGSNVVGYYEDASFVTHGFLYDGTTFTTLDPAGSIDTQATGVSGSNVVGWYYDAGGVEHGFLYQPLGTLGTTTWEQNETGYSSAITISDGTGPFGTLTQSGLPAGLTASLSGSTITISGTPTVAGTFNDIQISVTDANGEVASGTYSLTITPAPTLATWGVTTLDPAGSTFTQVTGVSGSNVVGWYEDASGVNHGFLYNGTTFTTLDPAGSISTSVTGGLRQQRRGGLY